jgi:hypothetical protein
VIALIGLGSGMGEAGTKHRQSCMKE